MRRMRSCLAWLGCFRRDRSGIGDGVAARDRGAAPAATFPNGLGTHSAMPMRNGTLPALGEATRAVEVRHQGELLGALSVTKRRGEALTPIEQKLVDDLAHQRGWCSRTWV